jgi:hypothetical protein
MTEQQNEQNEQTAAQPVNVAAPGDESDEVRDLRQQLAEARGVPQQHEQSEADKLREELAMLRKPAEPEKESDEVSALRKEIADLRQQQEDDRNQVLRGDADGVSAPLRANQETRDNTHRTFLADGRTVETSGNIGTHYGDDEGVSPITSHYPL